MSQRVESKQQERTIFALTHIGVGPRLERTDLGGAVIRIRKEDARNLPQYGIGLDAADERQTVNSGHLCVNQDRGGLDFGRQLQSPGATLGLGQSISVR